MRLPGRERPPLTDPLTSLAGWPNQAAWRSMNPVTFGNYDT